MKIISTYILFLITGILFGQSARHVCHHEDIGLFPLDNLNTKSIEFSPIYYQQGLVYVVAKEKSNFLDPKTGRAYFDLMYADVGPDGEVSKSVSFSPNIRTQYHEGSCTFSSDGKELFFTRSNLSGGQGINDEKGLVQLKIYSAVKGEEDWEQISELPFCSNEYAVAHPALSEDGLHLIFSSDMPGGYGGMDLYIVSRTDGIWSTPVNLGAIVNTKGHELFPYWHPLNYLFFASDGHTGEGGLDLFVTAPDTSYSFKDLQHLETPFNSSRDDLSMIVSPDGTSGYLASDRKPTKGKDDLYRWTSSQTIFCIPPPDPRAKKEILVIDENENIISTAHVWLIPMNQEGPSLYKEHFSTALVPKEDKDGAFYLRWGVTEELSTETADAVSDAQGKVMLGADKKLTYILVAQHDGHHPAVEIIPGDQVPSYIRMKKIKTEDSQCLRTIFTVYNDVGTVPLNGAKIQLTGPCLPTPMIFYTDDLGSATKCLPQGCALKAEFMQVGYAQHAFTFTPTDEDENWKIYLKSSDDLTAPPAPIASGTMIVLDNIYYDFNKSVIRQGEAGELIALAKILKEYPDLTIELTSHTDTRGTAEYNMELSARRSESSKSYLVLLGIDASRIITKAAGESAPRNKCLDGVPCSETEHQYNRRTEVRIINPAQGMQIKYKAEG
jgi:outer membrane protein OmpA-like peptidoglycan-associated protein